MDKVRSIKETFAQIQEISEWRGYITKQRFVGYAKAKAPYTDREASALWKVWEHIVELNWYRLGEVKDEALKQVLDIAREAYESVCKGAHIRYVDDSPKTPKWKVYYRREEGGELHRMEVDLRNKEDVLKYALLLQQEGVEILFRADYYKTVEASYGTRPINERKKIDIYNGDIIFCSDKDSYGWSDSSGAYVCTLYGYKKLMYTQGRGYLRRGEPDFEQNSDNEDCLYSDYMFNAYDKRFDVVGNIYMDKSVLMEKKQE